MRTGWQLSAVANEAWANTLAAPKRLVVLGAIVMLLAAATIWLELSAFSEAQEIERQFAAAGGYVAVVSAEEGVSASACETIEGVSGIVGSGGLRAGGQVASTASPRVAFQRLEVTRGIVPVWDPQTSAVAGRYLVGRAAANELGLSFETWVDLGDAGRARTAVIDPTLRSPLASRAFLDLVPPEGRVDECWVEFAPRSFEPGLRILPAHFAQDEATARRAVERGVFAQNPSDLIATRLSRWAWLPAGLVAIAIFALLAFFRRPETAVYQAFGLTRPGLLLMFQLEIGALTATCVAIGTAWAIAAYAVIVGLPAADQTAHSMATAFSFALLVIAAGPLATLAAGAGSPASLLKER